MKELGLFLIFVGIIATALPMINPTGNYVFLDWMNNWGPNAAWAIRGGITLLGFVLWRVGGRRG